MCHFHRPISKLLVLLWSSVEYRESMKQQDEFVLAFFSKFFCKYLKKHFNVKQVPNRLLLLNGTLSVPLWLQMKKQ